MATHPKGSAYMGRRWKPFDVCLLDVNSPGGGARVKVKAMVRAGREAMVEYHIGGKVEIVNSTRLSPLPMDHQP
jgi:hypothetical protein